MSRNAEGKETVQAHHGFSARWLILPILVGYLGAACFYSPYIGINGQNRIACPLCPFIDVIGGGLQTFVALAAALGTMNAFLLAVPFLGLMAYKAWTLRIRQELPGWRAAIGLGAIVLTLLGWLLMCPLGFFVWSWAPRLSAFGESSVVPTIALGAAAALALSGKPRVYLVLSGLGMLALCRFMLGLSL